MSTTSNKYETLGPVIVREVDQQGTFEIKYQTTFANGATETYVTRTNKAEFEGIKTLAGEVANVLKSSCGENREGQNISTGLPIALYKLRDSGVNIQRFIPGEPSHQLMMDICSKYAALPHREFATQVELELTTRMRDIQESVAMAGAQSAIQR